MRKESERQNCTLSIAYPSVDVIVLVVVVIRLLARCNTTANGIDWVETVLSV